MSFYDLEAVDERYFTSMKQILDNKLEDLGVEMTFSTETNAFGLLEVHDLIENGRNIPVTDQTKEEYVRLIAIHKMSESLRDQIDAFLEGFYLLIPPELISIFDAQQLELLICGLPDIDMVSNFEYNTSVTSIVVCFSLE